MSCLSLTLILATQGRKRLLIIADPQCNCRQWWRVSVFTMRYITGYGVQGFIRASYTWQDTVNISPFVTDCLCRKSVYCLSLFNILHTPPDCCYRCNFSLIEVRGNFTVSNRVAYYLLYRINVWVRQPPTFSHDQNLTSYNSSTTS